MAGKLRSRDPRMAKDGGGRAPAAGSGNVAPECASTTSPPKMGVSANHVDVRNYEPDYRTGLEDYVAPGRRCGRPQLALCSKRTVFVLKDPQRMLRLRLRPNERLYLLTYSTAYRHGAQYYCRVPGPEATSWGPEQDSTATTERPDPFVAAKVRKISLSHRPLEFLPTDDAVYRV
ncbi:unnamed protein product [Calypogeia fissa]